jgi:hypothetical protein
MVLPGFGFDEVEDDRGRGKKVLGEAGLQGGGYLERGQVPAVAVTAFKIIVSDVGVGLAQEVAQPVEALAAIELILHRTVERLDVRVPRRRPRRDTVMACAVPLYRRGKRRGPFRLGATHELRSVVRLPRRPSHLHPPSFQVPRHVPRERHRVRQRSFVS